eukprot:g18372.t1
MAQQTGATAVSLTRSLRELFGSHLQKVQLNAKQDQFTLSARIVEVHQLQLSWEPFLRAVFAFPPWVDNLKEPTGMEELRRLAARSDALARGVEEVKEPEKVMKEAQGRQEVKSSSGSSGGRKKKKKKSFKPSGKKDHAALYKGTGLDQDARIRKKISRLARRAMKKKSKSSSTTGTSSPSEAEEGMEDLFQESQRTQLASKAGPGALAYHAIRQMRKQMLQVQGQEGLEMSPVGAVGLQFYRQILRPKMTPVMAREALNVSAALDALLSCQSAHAADVLVQRLKALESMASGSSWQMSQRFKIVPMDLGSLASQAEATAVARENREEQKSRQLQKGSWESSSWKGGKSDQKGDKGKGKTKGKDGKSKGGDKDRARGDKADK